MPVAFPFRLLVASFILHAAASWLRAAAPDVIPDIASEGYLEIHRLDLPPDAAWSGGTDIPYTLNRPSEAGAFDRAGYFLELTRDDGTTDWVWASFLTGNLTAEDLGVPHDVTSPAVRQRTVDGLTVLSNVPGVETGSFFEGGSLEMWWQATSPANTAKVFAGDQYFQRFDWADSPDGTKPPHGSFQIHNPAARQAVLCWNGWATGGAPDDLGIGNGTPSLDWMTAANAGTYSSRRLSVWVRPKRFSVTFSQRPQFRQIIVRDRPAGTAVIPVAGSESWGGWQAAVLRVLRNGVQMGTEIVQPLTYSSGSAPFTFSPTLPAERAHYDLEIWLRQNSGPDRPAWSIRDIAVGEAFLVYGQSNAVASHRAGTSASALGYHSPWVRTFGVYTPDPVQLDHSRLWTIASPDDYNFYASNIGQWPQVLAMAMADEENIPVAVINGARGGTPLTALLRDDAEPDNLSDVGRVRCYNRMRHLADSAGLRTKLRSIFIHQGESDSDGTAYTEGMTSLRDDLRSDYPALEWIFTAQISAGCGEAPPAHSKRDAQRRLEDLFPDVRVMTTNGLRLADGCHFFFTGGYQELGERFFQQARRDLFGSTVPSDSEAPNPLSAGFVKPFGEALLLPWRRPVTSLTPDGDPLADFVLNGSAAHVTAAENTPAGLLLTLDRPAATATAVSWVGRAEEPGWLRNSRGIPLMTFAEPLTPRFPSVTVSLLPGDASAVGDPVILQATAAPHSASPASPIQSLRILVDGVTVGSAGNASTLQLPWTPLSPGQHTVTAEAIAADGWGAKAQSVLTASPLLGPHGITEGIQAWLHGWSALTHGPAPTRWPDASGRHHSPETPAAISPPTGSTTGIGLFPAVEFAVDGRLVGADGWPAGDWTAACLVQWTDASGTSSLFGAGTGPGAWEVGLNDGSQLVLRQGASVRAAADSPTVAAGVPHVVFADCHAATGAVRIWLDDGSAANGVASPPPPGGPWQLAGSFSGKIGAFAFFNRRLDDSERAAIRNEWLALTGLDSISYPAWSTATIPTPADRGPGADPDKDGLPNIVEYAFGEPPAIVASPLGKWSVERQPTNLLIRYRLPSSRPDASVGPQSSSDLGQWSPLLPSRGPTSNGIDEWSATVPLAPGRRFLRLSVSPVP